MKKFFLLSLVAVFFGSVSAQTQTARTDRFAINKDVDALGYVIDFPVDKSDKVISAAFQEMLEKAGESFKSGKSSSVKGFTNYVNKKLPPVSASNYSYYFKVETDKKSKVTRLYFLVLSDGENPVQSELMPTLDQKVKDFLNNFPEILTDYENNLKLKDAESLLAKLKKDNEKLKKEREGLEKDLKNKENEMISKEKEIQNAEAEIEKFQNLLRK